MKTGSKMAARYNASIGDALEEAMMVPPWGNRALCWARDLDVFSKVKSCGSECVHTLS